MRHMNLYWIRYIVCRLETTDERVDGQRERVRCTGNVYYRITGKRTCIYTIFCLNRLLKQFEIFLTKAKVASFQVCISLK